jgi:hypothetical protein
MTTTTILLNTWWVLLSPESYLPFIVGTFFYCLFSLFSALEFPHTKVGTFGTVRGTLP